MRGGGKQKGDDDANKGKNVPDEGHVHGRNPKMELFTKANVSRATHGVVKSYGGIAP
jgi:hypothetical protein